MKYLKSMHVPLSLSKSALTNEELEEFREQLTQIGERVQSLREKRGWTKEELAKRAETTVAIINEIESGTHPLSEHLLHHLGRVFDVSWHEFL